MSVPLSVVRGSKAASGCSSATPVTQALRDDAPPIEILGAMRARLAIAFDDPATPARDLAALSRRLLEVDDRIRAEEAALKEAEREQQEANLADEAWEGV